MTDSRRVIPLHPRSCTKSADPLQSPADRLNDVAGTVHSYAIDPNQLDDITLFSVLDETQRQSIVAGTRRIVLEEGERLFDMGQPAERFYLVISGQIKLFRLSESGNEKIIEIMGPRMLFAEAVMFFAVKRYPINAAALTASEVYGFETRRFLELLRESNDLCFDLLGKLSLKLHGMINEIDRLTLQNATSRVVHFLLELLPDRHTESAVVELPAPKYSIAALLSITPETFSRILHAMEHDGVIRVHGSTIAIPDVERLRHCHNMLPGVRSRLSR
jgi:CRP/FNR family transcriptional regulator, dissimilatory nitrate respiration regulator